MSRHSEHSSALWHVKSIFFCNIITTRAQRVKTKASRLVNCQLPFPTDSWNQTVQTAFKLGWEYKVNTHTHTHERPPVATQIQYTAPEMHSVIFLLYANEVLELHVFFPCFPPDAPSDRFILWGCSQTCYFRKRCTPNKCRYIRYLIENCTYGDQQSGKMQALPFLLIKKGLVSHFPLLHDTSDRM